MFAIKVTNNTTTCPDVEGAADFDISDRVEVYSRTSSSVALPNIRFPVSVEKQMIILVVVRARSSLSRLLVF